MKNNSLKCIILLSCKSSGSSALQNYLTKIGGVNHINWTRHFENETLYWTKAASILELEQQNMLDSEVPLPKDIALKDLKFFLSNNLNDSYVLPDDPYDLIFDGWKQLCIKFGPVFLEKSPHHLHQWSSIELIMESMYRNPDIDHKLIGLVRNPQAMIYSSWKRWKSLPEKNQFEWCTAQRNLLKLKTILKDNLFVVRYEDLVSDAGVQNDILNYLDLRGNIKTDNYFHKKSVSKWINDTGYGFQLHPDIYDIAGAFGYTSDNLKNGKSVLWPIYKLLARIKYKISKRIK